MTIFYLVRHGQTELNLAEKFQGGDIDSPLTEEGIKRIEKFGMYLKDETFDCVVSSSQYRAYHTAEIIMKKNNNFDGSIEKDNGIKEIGFGDWEGKLVTDYQHLEMFKKFKQEPHLYNGKGHHAENYDEVFKRGKRVLEGLAKRYPKGKVLVVAHGVTLITLLNCIVGGEIATIRSQGLLDNVSLSILERDTSGQYKIIKRNSLEYL